MARNFTDLDSLNSVAIAKPSLRHYHVLFLSVLLLTGFLFWPAPSSAQVLIGPDTDPDGSEFDFYTPLSEAEFQQLMNYIDLGTFAQREAALAKIRDHFRRSNENDSLYWPNDRRFVVELFARLRNAYLQNYTIEFHQRLRVLLREQLEIIVIQLAYSGFSNTDPAVPGAQAREGDGPAPFDIIFSVLGVNLIDENYIDGIALSLGDISDFDLRTTFCQTLSTAEEEAARIAVARSAYCREPFLTALSSDSSIAVRREVVWNVRTALGTLTMLAGDPSELVRREVAFNTRTPSETLDLLGNDPVDLICEIVADNRNTPVDTLRRLSRSLDRLVRAGVASNPNTPLEILRILVQDEDFVVSSSAASEILRRLGPLLIGPKAGDTPGLDPKAGAILK